MNSIQKINLKLIILVSISLILLLTMSIKIFDNTLSTQIENTYETTHEKMLKDIENLLRGLSLSVEKVSTNDEIQSILSSTTQKERLLNSEVNDIISEIDKSQNLLQNIYSFVGKIYVASEKGNQLISTDIISNDFYITERPWYENLYEYQPDGYDYEVSISKIHEDLTTKKDAICMVDPINNPSNGEIIGYVTLDIYIEELTDYIKSYFDGESEVYLHIGNNKSYHNGEIVNSDVNVSDGQYMINSEGMTIVYDKKTNSNYKSITKSSIYNISVYFTIGIMIVIIIILSMKFISRDIMKSSHKFKSLLGEEEILLLNTQHGELERLNLISDLLKSSLDEKTKRLIYYDDLTGMPNRKKMLEITDRLIKYNKEFAIIFIDLNKFKVINDFYGHMIGDRFLKEFSQKLSLSLGNKGELVRFSGDEFVLVYTHYTTDEELMRFYDEEILSMFKHSKLVQDKFQVSFSCGVSVYPRDGRSLDELIAKSDFMMYENKNTISSNKLLFFNNEIYEKMNRVELIKSNLKNAVFGNELSINYQPIVNSELQVDKLEALIRWESPTIGKISPLEFIKYAEETGEIIDIGYWVIDKVCKDYNEIKSSYNRVVKISINVSPVQLMEEDFSKNLIKTLKCSGINNENICIEITESVYIESNNVILENLNYLYNSGIEIALDDFGTGYSSFSYLTKIKMNVLKIDKVFIDNATYTEYEIIKSISSIAHQIGLEVVIEGVETQEQMRCLQQVNCDLFQGYYISKPLNIEDTIEFLNNNNKILEKTPI